MKSEGRALGFARAHLCDLEINGGASANDSQAIDLRFERSKKSITSSDQLHRQSNAQT
jgi:hypothetical protein